MTAARAAARALAVLSYASQLAVLAGFAWAVIWGMWLHRPVPTVAAAIVVLACLGAVETAAEALAGLVDPTAPRRRPIVRLTTWIVDALATATFVAMVAVVYAVVFPPPGGMVRAAGALAIVTLGFFTARLTFEAITRRAGLLPAPAQAGQPS